MVTQVPVVPEGTFRRGARPVLAPRSGGDAAAIDVVSVDLRRLQYVVVEDDEGDALLLQAVMEEAGIPAGSVRWFPTLSAGRDAVRIAPADCVLVDLGLPDASGLDAVRAMTSSVDTAVIVLTGLSGNSGQPALAAGAQDYLSKDGLLPEVLSRAVRYAVERKRADRAVRALEQARLRSTENARLERGLLPRPRTDGSGLAVATTYRAGRDGTLLGGDFYDLLVRPDGTVRAVIGDVMGHGPDEAALGVHLRVAWRSLVLAGVPDADVLATLDTVLTVERAVGAPFVTLCDVVVAPDRRQVAVRCAGHPAPIVLGADGAATALPVTVVPPLGIGADLRGVAPSVVTLGDVWSLLLYTDGLLDGFRDHADLTDIGFGGLLRAASQASSREPSTWLGGVVDQVPRAVTDDMAVVAVATRAVA